MKITKKQLAAVMQRAGTARIDKYLPVINEWADKFGITTPLRMAHYLAQIAHESAELKYTKEIASGRAYEGRKDLGNTHKGDGERYKGRGLIQITGRANYTAYKEFCGYDVVSRPELLEQPLGAVKSSMWYWQRKGLNELADKDDLATITKRINGGMNGYASRRIYLLKAKKSLNV